LSVNIETLKKGDLITPNCDLGGSYPLAGTILKVIKISRDKQRIFFEPSPGDDYYYLFRELDSVDTRELI
jgi:hypothetical protein